jgi:hypothetical protein
MIVSQIDHPRLNKGRSNEGEMPWTQAPILATIFEYAMS